MLDRMEVLNPQAAVSLAAGPLTARLTRRRRALAFGPIAARRFRVLTNCLNYVLCTLYTVQYLLSDAQDSNFHRNKMPRPQCARVSSSQTELRHSKWTSAATTDRSPGTIEQPTVGSLHSIQLPDWSVKKDNYRMIELSMCVIAVSCYHTMVPMYRPIVAAQFYRLR